MNFIVRIILVKSIIIKKILKKNSDECPNHTGRIADFARDLRKELIAFLMEKNTGMQSPKKVVEYYHHIEISYQCNSAERKKPRPLLCGGYVNMDS